MSYFVEGLTIARSGTSSVRHIGKYATLEDAIKAAELVIDRCLIANHGDGMTVAELFYYYRTFGEEPFIFSDDEMTINVGVFNHFKHARQRCIAICV
jgi:hypothetical protein